MTHTTRKPSRPVWRAWPPLAVATGGAVMIAIWPVFTTLHGPTSVNQGGELLGLDPEFWGAMMEGPSLLLVTAGLLGLRWELTQLAGRPARVGFGLAVIGLLLPGVANLVALAVFPPLLAPVLGAGLMLLARGSRTNAFVGRLGRRLLLGMGGTQIFAFLWTLAIRPDVLDRINGYRIYGIVANVLFGLGWMLLGITLMHRGVDHHPTDVKRTTATS